MYKTLDIKWLNVLNFHTIDWLYRRLQEVGNSFQSRISFKIPSNFVALAAHNDRLVIHFSDSRCISEIQKILDEWEKKMGVPMLERHYLRTEVVMDQKGTSFSDLIARHYAMELATGMYSV